MEIKDLAIPEPTVRTFNCHYCKKLISLATVPEVIGFCDIGCAENWKKEIPFCTDKFLMSQDPMNKEQKTGSDPPANNQSHKNIKQFKGQRDWKIKIDRWL